MSVRDRPAAPWRLAWWKAGDSVCFCSKAGGKDNNIWVHIPLGVGKLLTNEKYAWKFFSTPQQHMKGQAIYSPRGKVLGGSSALNGMAHIWGEPAVFDSWRDSGLTGWGYDDLKPYFMRLENASHTDSPDRGHDGPVRITDLKVRMPDPLSDAFVAACGSAGIKETPTTTVSPTRGPVSGTDGP